MRPLGLNLVNRSDQQDFGKTETAERDLRDLEHGNQIMIYIGDTAYRLPIRGAAKSFTRLRGQ